MPLLSLVRHTMTPLGLTAAAALTSGVLVSAPPPSADAAVAMAPVRTACGTWVLEQVSSAQQLERRSASISAALRTTGVTGFSMRVPWSSLEQDWSMLDKGLAIARQQGKQFAVRFVAGRYTPKRIFDQGAYSFVNKARERIPQPFSPTGTAGNPVFERAYAAMVDKLASWSRAHGVRVMHVPWYGFQWAEIYNGSELESRPGYSWKAWLDGHKKLARIALDRTGDDLAAEFALSGHWGKRGLGSGEVADALVDIVGANSPRLIVQGNGMGRFNNDTTNRPINHGKQMYNGGDYNWGSVYNTLTTNQDHYLEVYTTSFSQPSRAKLASSAEQFRRTRC